MSKNSQTQKENEVVDLGEQYDQDVQNLEETTNAQGQRVRHTHIVNAEGLTKTFKWGLVTTKTQYGEKSEIRIFLTPNYTLDYPASPENVRYLKEFCKGKMGLPAKLRLAEITNEQGEVRRPVVFELEDDTGYRIHNEVTISGRTDKGQMTQRKQRGFFLKSADRQTLLRLGFVDRVEVK